MALHFAALSNSGNPPQEQDADVLFQQSKNKADAKCSGDLLTSESLSRSNVRSGGPRLETDEFSTTQ